MKLRVVSSKKEIDELNRNEQMVHLTFRASNIDIFRLLQSCPNLRAIQMPTSYHRTMSRAGQMFLEIQDVDLIEGDVWGHRKDINEYYTIDEPVTTRIDELRSEGMGMDEITGKLSRETKLSEGLLKYVVKQTV